MRTSWSGLLLLGIAVTSTGFLVPRPLAAQQGVVISGKVTSKAGEALGGAVITVGSTNLGAATNASGSYALTIGADAARGQEVVLTVRYIGYKPALHTVTLSPGTQELNFQLEPDPLRLEEIVVTGEADATARKNLAHTVASVGKDQLQEVPGSSALVALEGKVAALRLIPQSAQPGSDVAIRLRGATSIGGRQDPLIIVDGVITPFGLADVAPEDISRVEVIKGAAASSLYGSNAANGVVQVFTDRGNSLPDGTLRVTSRVEGGVNDMPNRLQFSHHHAWEIDANGDYVLNASGGRIVKTDQIADNPFKSYHDDWSALVNNGAFYTGYLSVGERRGNTNFQASFENTRNEGVIFGLGGYTRRNFRLNIDQQLRSNVDASFSAFYGISSNGRTPEGQAAPFYGLMFVQPDVNIAAPCPVGTTGGAAGVPYCPVVPLSGDVANDFNPLYQLANEKLNQDRNRFTGSGRMRWRLTDWLSAEGSFAFDQEAQEYSDEYPFGYRTASGQKTPGSLLQRTNNDWEYNTGITLTSVRHFGSSITNTTKIGTSFESQRNRFLQTFAGELVVAGVPEFAGALTSTLSAASTDEKYRTLNYLATSQFVIKDRYIVDGLVRRDGSSLFGPESRWSTYYRASGAWRVTQDIHIPGIDEWKLRASYGTAGLRPNFSDQYEVLGVNASGFTFQTLGNPLLKPAHSAELEAGTNIDFAGGRFSAEYSFSRKNTTDQLIQVDLPAVAGFPQQWQNVGALRSTTHELTFAARLINAPQTGLTLTIVGDRTRQVITDWPLPERLYSYEQMPAAFFLGRGSDLGVLYGNRWVRNINDLYADPAKKALSGAGQTWSPDSVMINEDGYVVRRSAYGTPNERAIKYTYCKTYDTAGNCAITSQTVKIGNANPDFNMSFNLRFNFHRLLINGLLDWTYGGDIYNGMRQWAFQATRDRVQDQAAKPVNDALCGAGPGGSTVPTDPMPKCPRKALPYYGVGFYNGLDPNDYFVERGTYAKLKEFSVSYTFPAEQLQRVGIFRGFHEAKLSFIARNLFTITKYSGLDPEISGLFGDPFQVRMDWYQYPQFRTFSTTVELSF